MPSSTWEFAIDVGGTFTDCLARRPDGRQVWHKLLSSGVIKGTAGPGSGTDKIIDPARTSDPPGFWVGYRCRQLDSMGTPIASGVVSQFDHRSGVLTLSRSARASRPPAFEAGAAYELTCDFEAPIIGIRYLLGLPLAEPVPAIELRLGTTRGTNALLTRSGAKTALLTTRGFGDLLDIGYQDRPRLFDLTTSKPASLVEVAVEIDQRVSATGEVLIPLDEIGAVQQLQELRRQAIESLAICLLHADLHPAHEQRLATLAASLGFVNVSCSHQVAPLVKLVARAETTVVDAYLNPVLRDYLAKLQLALPGSQIRLMTSAGGLVVPTAFRGHESVLSGPAGGVVGYAQGATTAGFPRAIGFDMGGTSTDVSRYSGAYELEYESRKAGVRLMAPTLAIATVAAGGGSICQFDGTQLKVGPQSAGADPGPACYGRGGPLTVTDLNFYLGRIAVERFPFALDRVAVEDRLQEVAQSVADATGEQLTAAQLATGLLQIANANMVQAVRGISVAQGANPSDFIMVAFGGAAPQHACAVARDLGIRQILCHPHAGILSAYGISQADLQRHAVVGMAARSDELVEAELLGLFEEMTVEPTQQVVAAGCPPAQIEVRRSLDMRYVGTDAACSVPFQGVSALKHQFESIHLKRFGYCQQNRGIEVVAARVQIVGKANRPTAPSKSCPPHDCRACNESPVGFGGQPVMTRFYHRADLPVGARLSGPAVVTDDHSTVVIEPGWEAELLSGKELLLSDRDDVTVSAADDRAAEAVMLEVFNNLLVGVAQQMGHVLRRTASSVNVKERLDYSCAVFTANGELVANAPHVPVHLGAMGAAVRAILADRPQLREGDVFVTNDPYRGGSHLPDVTVITPVHAPRPSRSALQESPSLLFFTACRAHHAEIGGIRPGSMPPASKNLAEEGVLISNFALIQNGISHEDELRNLLASGPYPSRCVDENLADIRAQVAANRQGASDLLTLVQRYSFPLVETQISNIQQAAEVHVRQALARFRGQHCEFIDYLESAGGESLPIQVRLTFPSLPAAPAVIIDFTGSAPVDAGNLNANRAIVTAAVIYVLRLLVDEEIPLNEGALRAVELVLPHGILHPPVGDSPESTPAVVAGNVETSQRIVDVLLGGLGIAAASQGTMNNLLFGDSTFGYYETICGGSGATSAGPGADAIQVHMTNTRSTDAEVLERRLPVRLWQFSIRSGSGGAGRYRGGNGVVRRLEFLAPLQLSLITQRRGPHPPYGVAGGDPGDCGENGLIRASGQAIELPGICEIEVEPGDQIIVKTPGGGGYGRP